MSNKFSKFRLPRLKRRSLKSLSGDERGVSALEFALIAPFLVLLYFGGIELSLLMQADRRITTVAATVGDLTSRVSGLTEQDVRDIFDSANLLITPLDPTGAEMVLSSLVADDEGNVTVDWSRSRNTGRRSRGSSVPDLPDDIVPPNGSVILAEVAYDYESVLDFVPEAQGRLEDRFYVRPRRSARVEIIQD